MKMAFIESCLVYQTHTYAWRARILSFDVNLSCLNQLFVEEDLVNVDAGWNRSDIDN